METPPRPLRILYLIDSLRAEGSQQSLLQIVRALSGLGYDPRVGSLHGTGDLVGDFEAAGVTVHAHEGSRSRFEMLRYADRLIESSKPDLVHTTLYDADVLGHTFGTISDARYWVEGEFVSKPGLAEIHSDNLSEQFPGHAAVVIVTRYASV